MFRENISKLLRKHNSHQQQTTFVREIPQIQKPSMSTRPIGEFRQPEKPTVPRLTQKSLPSEEHYPMSFPPTQFFPLLTRETKVDEQNALFKKQLENYRDLSQKFDEIIQQLQRCNTLASLETNLPSLSSLFKQSFNLFSAHCWTLESSPDPFLPSSSPVFSFKKLYQEIDSTISKRNENVQPIDLKDTFRILSRAKDHHGVYRSVHSSDKLPHSELMNILHPNQMSELTEKPNTIYCLDLSNEEDIQEEFIKGTNYPSCLLFFVPFLVAREV
jgi:hypothetical protein